MHELESHATFYIHQKVLKHPNVASVYIKALEHMYSVTHTSPSSEDLIIINSYRRTRMHTNTHTRTGTLKCARTIQHYFMHALDVYACGIAVQETRSLSLTTLRKCVVVCFHVHATVFECKGKNAVLWAISIVFGIDFSFELCVVCFFFLSWPHSDILHGDPSVRSVLCYALCICFGEIPTNF